MMDAAREGEQSQPSRADSVHPQTIIVGLGNPILGDDGVGWRIAERLQATLHADQETAARGNSFLRVEVDCLALGGLSLMERLVGYRRAILVDAITTQKNPPGTVTCFPLEDLPIKLAGHMHSSHDTSLPMAIQLGRLMGAQLPEQILVVAVEADNLYYFSDQLTQPIEAAIPVAEQAIMDILQSWV